jgi:hypothetical protein
VTILVVLKDQLIHKQKYQVSRISKFEPLKKVIRTDDCTVTWNQSAEAMQQIKDTQDAGWREIGVNESSVRRQESISRIQLFQKYQDILGNDQEMRMYIRDLSLVEGIQTWPNPRT